MGEGLAEGLGEGLGEGLAEGLGKGLGFWDAPDGVGLGVGDFLGVGLDWGFGVVDFGGVVWAEINDVEGELPDFSNADAMPHPNPIVQKQTTKKRIRVNSDRVNFCNFNISNFLKLSIFNRDSPQQPFHNRFSLLSTSGNQTMGQNMGSHNLNIIGNHIIPLL